MRKKLKERGGFTMVEMLCAVVILVMLCLLTSSGLSLAMESYRDIIAESETQLLLNDLSDAMADKLRYAIVTVKQSETTNADGTVTITTENCTFSLENVALLNGGKVKNVWKEAEGDEGAREGWISDDGKVMMGIKNLLPSGAYGSEMSSGERRYKMEAEAEEGEAVPKPAVTVTWDNDQDPDNTAPDLNDLREGQIITFHITLKVKDGWGPVSREKELTVRCMNPVKKEVS